MPAFNPNTPRGHGVFGILVFEFHGLLHKRLDFISEFSRPQLWIFQFDGIDEVNAEITMQRFVTQDVLILFRMVFERHQLVDIGLAVDDALILGVDATG
jgi:hypothetical protein